MNSQSSQSTPSQRYSEEIEEDDENLLEGEDEYDAIEEEEYKEENPETKSLWNVFWYICVSILGGVFLFGNSSPLRWVINRWFRSRNQSKDGTTFSVIGNQESSSGSFFDRLFTSPFLDDDERVRLRPVSVNTYVHVFPTHQNDDGVFVKVLIENSSELATENV